MNDIMPEATHPPTVKRSRNDPARLVTISKRIFASAYIPRRRARNVVPKVVFEVKAQITVKVTAIALVLVHLNGSISLVRQGCHRDPLQR